MFAVVSKIKTKITKIAIILFMLVVDAPPRICLLIAGGIYIFISAGVFAFTLLLNLVGMAFWLFWLGGTLWLGEDMEEFRFAGFPYISFMTLLSMFISGIAGLQVVRRARPYRYNPPYLDREIINKRTNVIPLCVLGIACLFYVHWPPIDNFYELYIDADPGENFMIFIHTYGFTAGFVYAIAERIILKIVVLTLDHTRGAPVDEISTSKKEKL